jgi:branched-subunit amino acid ABC-type transport system permease component
MKMSGWWFVVVGVLVTVVSWSLMVAQKGKMGLFLFVGVAMLVFGIARLFIDRTVERKAPAHEPLVTQTPRTYSLHTIPRVCGICGAKNNPRANFCGHCGHRL